MSVYLAFIRITKKNSREVKNDKSDVGRAFSLETVPRVAGYSGSHLNPFEHIYVMFAFSQSIEPLSKLDWGDVWSHLFQYSCQYLEQDDNSIAKGTGFGVSGILFLVIKHVRIVKLIPILAV